VTSRGWLWLVGAGASIGGIALGALATVWFLGKFMDESVLVSARAGIATKVVVLKSLREGKTMEAIQRLEGYLDGDILGLLPFVRDEGRPERIAIEAAAIAATYRAAGDYDYGSSSPDVRAAVQEVLQAAAQPVTEL
jgi:hypothetical protein